jgi:hypothetical protein
MLDNLAAKDPIATNQQDPVVKQIYWHIAIYLSAPALGFCKMHPFRASLSTLQGKPPPPIYLNELDFINLTE